MEPNNNKQRLQRYSSVSSSPLIDLEFQNLNYTAGSKLILKSVSGTFASGELIGILGPSGAGKSTLLNVLAGRVIKGVTGSIKINDKPRDLSKFRKFSTYIMQEDLLQPLLSVNEAMTIAAKLKLGNDVRPSEKEAIIEEVLTTLGLEKCKQTRVERLSGGQRKRLAVALELVNNPPIVFLDEPSSGLDNVATKQCIDALRTLAGQRRTIICTIHQPPAAVLEQFHHLYFIANGSCIYNGSPSSLISHLSQVNLPCPITHNPAEYIIEVVQSNETHLDDMARATQNGKIDRRNSKASSDYDLNAVQARAPMEIYETNFPTSFFTQFNILFNRMMLQQKRNVLVLWIQLLNHLLSALLIGFCFYGIGNNASMAMSNFKLCVCVMHFFVYTYAMTPVLLFPFEFELLKREYFNGWYSLKAYYAALTFKNIPIVIILGLGFLLAIYMLSGQPYEWPRLLLFCTTGLTVAMTAEGFGIAVGSMFNIKNGSIVASLIISVILLLSIHGMGYGALGIDPFMKILMGLSYLRFAVVSICLAVYDERPSLECSDLYCHYTSPKLLLRDLGITNTTYVTQMIGLMTYLIVFRLIGFVALRYRLKPDNPFNVINYYITKFLRRK